MGSDRLSLDAPVGVAGNGVDNMLGYRCEIVAHTGQYFFPIKHAHKILATHARYSGRLLGQGWYNRARHTRAGILLTYVRPTMSADKDRATRRQKQKRAKDSKKQSRQQPPTDSTGAAEPKKK